MTTAISQEMAGTEAIKMSENICMPLDECNTKWDTKYEHIQEVARGFAKVEGDDPKILERLRIIEDFITDPDEKTFGAFKDAAKKWGEEDGLDKKDWHVTPLGESMPVDIEEGTKYDAAVAEGYVLMIDS